MGVNGDINGSGRWKSFTLSHALHRSEQLVLECRVIPLENLYKWLKFLAIYRSW